MDHKNDKLNNSPTESGGAHDIEVLLPQLRDPSWVESQAAAKRLVEFGNVAVPALISELRNPASEVRRRAAQALGQIGDERATGPLIDMLAADKDGLVRWAAALALGELGDSSATSSLVSALADEDRNLADAATKALVQIGKPAVAPLLNELAHVDYRVRRHAAQALSEIADRRATQPLIAALKDEDNWVRFSAAEGLGAIVDASAVTALIGLLEDDDSEVRGVAVVALGKIGDARALPALERLGDDSGMTWDDRTIAEVAEEARVQIELQEHLQEQKRLEQ